uniref:Replication protein n=1 Tax=Desulfovibrio sp. U5L TaxID=596152 RepID=I2Q574_9BACT
MSAEERIQGGYVKLWRKAFDSAVWTDPDLWRAWTCCLMLANHAPAWVKVGGLGEPVRVEAGQFITGRFEFHQAMYPKKRKKNPAAYTVWRWLLTLEKLENLCIKSCNKYSLITIVNWERYQCADAQDVQQNEPATSSKCAAGVQHACTNKNDKKKDIRIFSSELCEFRLAELLFDLIRQRNPEHKAPDLQAWAKHIDLMIRVDGRSPERIEEVIRWAARDSFWSKNILSTSKLREKFDALTMKMGAAKPRVDRSHLAAV